MELRDLYDDSRHLTGEVVKKGEMIPLKNNILVVLIWIRNSKNEFLIQKRNKINDTFWGSTGGHPKHNESSIEGIITEVKEEIGLDITNDPFILYYSGHETQRFFDLYYLEKDIDITTLQLQKEEVSIVKWATKEEIINLFQRKEFKKSHYEMFQYLLKYLQNQK